MFWFRKLLLSNVLPYKLWFFTVRKFRGDYVRLPSINDDFYFDGYPRSGNTFFKGLFEKSYPDRKFAHHLHSISGLKIALKAEIPIFIIIRNPKDAVTSHLCREVFTKDIPPSENLIERLLKKYVNYYKFVYENINYINVIEFELAIENEIQLLKSVAKITGFKKRSDIFLKETLKDYKLLMKRRERQKDPYASSLPNEERDKFKSEYQNKIQSSSTYKTTESIYNDVIEFGILS